VGDILFKEGRTRKGAKRLLRELKRRWEKKLARLDSDDPGHAVLRQWIKQTESHWPGLFHCYRDPKIPATNNAMEQSILRVKNLERRMANNPNPAVRFLRNAASTGIFLNRTSLPGEEFLARRSPQDLRQAAADLANRRQKFGAMQRARRDFTGELDRLEKLWKAASRGPPTSDIMIRSQRAPS